jgi:carotenoid cleavage dioxygenase
MTTPFPHSMDFTGFNAVSRVECEIYDLIVHGEVPKEINGAWYRMIPDPQYPPRLGDDTFLSGDGMMGRFWFEDGHVDYRQRYVMTERLLADRANRKSMFGSYRNPFTDDPKVKGVERGAANTTPIFHGGKLFALKEDSLPMELDPVTLETKGRWDFGGKLKSKTVTAHTRLDPETGDLYFYGYEAGGLATNAIAYCKADKDGNLVSEQWFEAPYVSLMHDFVVTERWALFPVFPTTASLERLKAGGPHWVYEPGKESYVGIMPRDGSVKEMRWFRYDGPASSFHYMNAYDDGDLVHMDFGLAQVNPFPFIQKASGIEVDPSKARSRYARWTFDMSKPGNTISEREIGPPGDMPRIATKDMGRPYEVGYYQRFDPTLGKPNISGPVGAGFNTVSRLKVQTGELRNLSMPPTMTVQEHLHVPSTKTGHEGYLTFVVDKHDVQGSEVWILEAEHPESGPIARIEMPLRLRCGVHGNWVDVGAF